MPTAPPRRAALVAAALVPLAALALLAACGDSGSGDDGSSGGGERATARGADLYAEACAACHGADLRGTNRGPSHLSQVYAPDHHPDEAFRAAIATGSPQHHWDFGDMPPVPGIDDDEVEAIIAYVREVQEREGLEPYPG